MKKLDFRIMPILWAMYFMNYVIMIRSEAPYQISVSRNRLTSSPMAQLDRNAIANARLNNLEDDLGLVGTQYNTCISILFVGYVAAFPKFSIRDLSVANIILSKDI